MKILDTSAWIEYFIGGERGRIVQGWVDGDEKIITPDIVLAEFARKCARDGLKDTNVKRMVYFITSRSTIETIDAKLSLLAARSWLKLTDRASRQKLGKPSLTDGILLAVARRHSKEGGVVITTDGHFKGLKEARMISTS